MGVLWFSPPVMKCPFSSWSISSLCVSNLNVPNNTWMLRVLSFFFFLNVLSPCFLDNLKCSFLRITCFLADSSYLHWMLLKTLPHIYLIQWSFLYEIREFSWDVKLNLPGPKPPFPTSHPVFLNFGCLMPDYSPSISSQNQKQSFHICLAAAFLRLLRASICYSSPSRFP